MRLATFNLESLGERPGMPLETKVAALRPALAELRADVLCLQEIDGAHPASGVPRRLLALERLLEGTDYAGYQIFSSTRRDGGGASDVHNLAIASRFPFVATRQVWNDLVPAERWRYLSADEEACVFFDRPILCARVAVGATELDVVNVHLRAPLASPVPGGKRGGAWRSVAAWAEGYYLAAQKRAAQALETRLLVDGLFDGRADAAIAVCGDFNCEPGNTAFRLIAGQVDGHPARALVAVEERLAAADRFTVKHAGRPSMVDHVLVSAALAARVRDVHATNRDLMDDDGAQVAGSTHAAVVVDLDL